MRPKTQQRDVAVVAASAIARLANSRIRRSLAQRLRAVFLPDMIFHVIRVQRAAAERADAGDGRRLIVAHPVGPQSGVGIDGVEIAIGKRTAVLSAMLEWQRAQLAANSSRPRLTAPAPNSLFEIGDQVLLHVGC